MMVLQQSEFQLSKSRVCDRVHVAFDSDEILFKSCGVCLS